MNEHELSTRPGGAAPGPRDHTPPPGARAMNALRWALFAGLMLLAIVSIGSYVWSHRGVQSVAKQAKVAKYRCPMHPSYTSDKPGECPICGMTLEPIPAGAAAGTPSAAQGDVPGLTSVHLTPERIQMIGVRTAVAARRPMGGALDLVGFVTPDETRLERIQLRVSGWVQGLFVNRTGERVASGQPLLSIYSPELYQSEQEYLIALGGGDTSGGSMGAMPEHESGAAESGYRRLLLLGVPTEEIARLRRERAALPRLTLRSPVAGTVLEKNVTDGQYVGAEAPLFTLADLSRVWVLADLYEQDLASVRAGDRARFTADALPGRSFEGRFEFVYPTVSTDTRTVKARLSLANPGGVLRPGMYGRVRVTDRGVQALAVPTEAVINTGEQKYVFLARSGGHFEPRRVETGAQEGDWVQILRGVAAGDTVVASASFLIDSESRLKAAIAGMGAQPGMADMPGMSGGPK